MEKNAGKGILMRFLFHSNMQKLETCHKKCEKSKTVWFFYFAIKTHFYTLLLSFPFEIRHFFFDFEPRPLQIC
jgi:hypothetical protein